MGAGRLALIAGLALASFAGSVRAEPLRWAVLVGNNQGGPGRGQLRWAEQDAARVARVLVELGRFKPERVRVLKGAEPEEVLETIRRLAAEARASEPAGSLIVVFYSGHADGKHLLMGDQRLAIADIKQAMDRSPAEVGLLILDACNAGAATRTKGGRSAPSFLRFDDIHRSRGRIILASAAAHELAQESDEIGSSVFTHYLISGLRGEADTSHDRRVNLAELYRYVYDRTVAETVDSAPGVQHPSFSYDLKGEGSIVLTDLNSGASGIMLPEAAEGRFLLFDRANKAVVAEVDKRAGERRLVPVWPGRYTIKKREHGHLRVAQIDVLPDQIHTVDLGAMREVAFADPVTKGWGLGLGPHRPRWNLSATGGLTAFGRAPAGGVWAYPSGGLRAAYSGWPAPGWAIQIGLSVGSWNSHAPLPNEDRAAFRMLTAGLNLSISRMVTQEPVLFEVGGRIKGVFVQRRFDDLRYTEPDETVALGPGVLLALGVRLGWFRIGLEVSGGVLFFAGADRTVIPEIEGTLTTGVNW